MSQIFVEGGALAGSGDELLGKLAEFLNNIGSLKIQAKVDGKRIAVSPRAATAKGSAAGKTSARKTTKKGEEKKKKKGKKSAEEETAKISKSKLKVYLKRFINKQGLSNEIRVLSGGPDTFTFHDKRILEELPAAGEG